MTDVPGRMSLSSLATTVPARSMPGTSGYARANLPSACEPQKALSRAARPPLPSPSMSTGHQRVRHDGHADRFASKSMTFSHHSASPRRHGTSNAAAYTSNMFLFRSQSMPEPSEALPGRPEPVTTPPPHVVNGRSLLPPYPEGTRIAEFAL